VIKRSATEVSYDAEADRAYVSVAAAGDGDADKQIVLDDERLPCVLVADLDGNGRLIGFVLLGASRALPLALLHELR
jgi:uncharacterized protein YuzE